MKLITLTLVLTLAGCSTIANYYDRTDPCQTGEHLGRPANYQTPHFCGANSGRITIYNNQGSRIGYIK